MVVATIMDEGEIYRNHPHPHQIHSSTNAAVNSVNNNGTEPYSYNNNAILMVRKERQTGERINQNHGIPMEASMSTTGTSVTTADSACHSAGADNQTKLTSSSQSRGTTGVGHGSNNSNSSYKIREIIEMLFYYYLEYGGSVRSEQFRNLVEVFLCPIFESLRIPNNNVNCNSRSSSSTRINCVSGSLLPSTSSTLSTTTCVATCLPATSSSSVGAPSCPTNQCSSSGGPVSTSNISNDIRESGERNGVFRLVQGDVLCCPTCLGILIEPVTIQCGHSYCRKCLQKEIVGHNCRQCSHSLTHGDILCKTNVLLGSLVEKWWPKEVTATNLRNEGNMLFQRNKVEEALMKYNEALNLFPNDHLSLGNRSHALLTAGRSEEALQDAEAATKYCPAWPKGHFRKSAALISLGRYEEAFLSLTFCMYLLKVTSCLLLPQSISSGPSPTVNHELILSADVDDPIRTHIITEMIKILQKIFLQTANAGMGSILKRHNIGEQVQFSPYPNGRKPCGNRHLHERKMRRNTDWNDSENTSSGDESDNQVDSCSSSSSTDYSKTWRKSVQRVHYPCGNCNYHHKHNQIQQDKSHANSSPLPLMDQLNNRMNRLLGRAKQDLKAFENRLKSQYINLYIRQVNPSLISSNDLECSLCYRLLFQPVSTGCGHTFCRSCLERCLDHNPACPLCKTSLKTYLANREHAINEFLEVAIRHFLPKEREERLAQHLEELNSTAVPTEGKNNLDVPVFVCTMAFPTIPCPLHVFEPRYRLMIRRCMENGSNRFGMCCYLEEGENNYGEIGTLLEIKNIQYFADGRSVVDTVGCRRFRVVRKTMVDGYNTARIEFLCDQPVKDEEIPVVTALHDKVFKEASEWLQSIGQVRRQRILSHFGPMPAPEDNCLGSSDGPSWIWWLLAILPLDSKAQLSILSMCSLQKRLECILKVLHFVKKRMGTIGE